MNNNECDANTKIKFIVGQPGTSSAPARTGTQSFAALDEYLSGYSVEPKREGAEHINDLKFELQNSGALDVTGRGEGDTLVNLNEISTDKAGENREHLRTLAYLVHAKPAKGKQLFSGEPLKRLARKNKGLYVNLDMYEAGNGLLPYEREYARRIAMKVRGPLPRELRGIKVLIDWTSQT